MWDIAIIWDDEDDRDEDVLRDDESEIEVSRSSGRPTAFGWSGSGERIAVVFEVVSDDPRMIYPVSAYPVPPKNQKWREKMKANRSTKPKSTAADRARHKAIREEFQHCPAPEDLRATGDYEGPIKQGAWLSVRLLIHELKQAREAAGLTLATVAKRTGMDQSTLSRLENGRQPNPTVDTLWRYARAVGRQLVLTHSDTRVPEPTNGKKTRSARK